MTFVYIIESESKKKWHYGSAEDILGTLRGHNRGRIRSTKGKGPWSFVFVRPFDADIDAQIFERYLKRNRDKPEVLKKFAMYFRYGIYPDPTLGMSAAWPVPAEYWND